MTWLFAFVAGVAVTAVLGTYVGSRNRRVESGPNANTAPSRGELAWHLVHVRDDVGSLFAAVSITNGLLAAMLLVLLSKIH